MILVLMGVSGSGKSTIGQLLAERIDYRFVEGDDYHPPESQEKMRQGHPLDDSDRRPWLMRLRSILESAQSEHENLVLACSALTAHHRSLLSPADCHLAFVFLNGDDTLLRERLEARAGHFMPASLLPSQLATLEEPDDAIRVSIDQAPEAIVDEILSLFLCGWGGDDPCTGKSGENHGF